MATLDLVRLPDDDPSAVLRDALEVGFTAFLVSAKSRGDVDDLGKADVYVLDGDRIVDDGDEVGRVVTVADADDQDRVRELAGEVDVVAVRTEDWTVIPLENLIGWFQDTATGLLAVVDDAEAAELALSALEVGVDGLVVETRDRAEMNAIDEVRRARGETVDLVEAEVVDVRPAGDGDRVCVDTTRMMDAGEGMLVGSQAGALFFVHSESLDSDYVSSRPFRVNAGPVHAYVLAPDGETRYLSELAAGDEVLVVDDGGGTSTGVVGRVKIEERPLLLVEAEIDGRRVSTILQNAETVAVVTPDGPVSVVDLEAGDTVLVYLGEDARHFGTAVDEKIVER